MKNRCFTEGRPRCPFRRSQTFLLVVMLVALASPGFAQTSGREAPRSFSLNDKSQELVERKVQRRVDAARLLAEDRVRGEEKRRPGPMRIAVPVSVNYTLENAGTWQNVSDGRLWRLRIQSPGAKNHNLGITSFDLPQGAKLWVYDPGHEHFEGPYTSGNRNQDGSLWTPLIEGDEIVVEVFVPTGALQPVVKIQRVNQGYRGLEKPGEKSGFAGTEGTCNNDVICSPEGDPWRDQIRAVGVYLISNDGGTGVCTGTMLNDIPHDLKPYFLSANHCLDHNGVPSSVVVYWNFESATCGTHGPGSISQNQTGAVLRANYAPTDFALFELNTMPTASPQVFYAGWDASGSAPAASVAIHQPSGDVKALSFSSSPGQSAEWTGVGDGGVLNATGNHWRIDWSSGVTEGGSSGSCIFETVHGRCVGQLHSGPSFCGATATDLHDYYGKFSESWTGGGTSATRLKDWLDPGNTGAMTNDGDPHITTANGVSYDFQGAGEYVSLRKPNGLEIQTRQTPISTSFTPGPDSHDGLATCVSLNTAVAARVGKHRVTYEPNLSGVPDPSGLQLRVDGVLKTLGAGRIDLSDGGRIWQTNGSGGIAVDFPDGTVMFVTPNWWAGESKWYLNVDVAGTPAVDGAEDGGRAIRTATPPIGGLMGTVPATSWLPTLPDGTSMGSMPGSLHQRYLDLYQKFGEAWRVTDANSLFDYAPGTSTDTFTLKSWPAENGPCTLPGVTPVNPASSEVAERACRQVVGANRHADCVFDVMATGNTGFADLYLDTQRVLQTGGAYSGGNTDTGGNNNTSKGKWAVFFDGGANFPHGTAANVFDPGFSFNAGLEYMFTPHVSAEGIFGYHRLGAPAGALNLFQFSGNVKTYLTAPPYKLRPFFNGGVGAYTSSSGTTRFGGNVGGGLLYEMTPKFGVQGSYNLHVINTPGSAFKFSTAQAGVRFVF